MGHIDSVVENHKAAVADHGVDLDKLFVIHRHIELGLRQVGAERATDLHGTDRPARSGAAAPLVDQLTGRHAECLFDQTALLDVAGKLERKRAARPANAIILVELAALGDDDGNCGETHHVVDDGRLAEQAFDGGDRRLVADDAALAFDRLQHRGFFAANVSAGAHADI